MTFLFFAEHKINCGQEKQETDQVFPVERLTKIIYGKDTEYNQRDYFLGHFQLEPVQPIRVSYPVSRNHQAVFQEGDSPADQYGFPQGEFLKFQMAIPGKGHKYVGKCKQCNGFQHWSKFNAVKKINFALKCSFDLP
jgi:penicillin-binding protein-related factor A (putative recombinase)